MRTGGETAPPPDDLAPGGTGDRDAMTRTGLDPEPLVALIKGYNPRCNEKLLARAFAFGEEMHEGQFRHSGEPYFTHPVAVAESLAKMQMDDATVITALLHDTIEDTPATFGQVQDLFGREIADETQQADDLRERMIEANQTQIEVDEPEEDQMALLMGAEADKPAEDDMSEEKLLRALMEAQGQR